MVKLRSLPPQLGNIGSQIGFAPGDEKAGDRARDQAAPWRAWYRTPRWQRLRQQVFVRDAYTCQRTGVLCVGKYPAPNSPVANHKRPHRGDPVLFWDPDNIETVTKAVHDSIVQAEEQSIPKGNWS